jgi:hypothetical protein
MIRWMMVLAVVGGLWGVALAEEKGISDAELAKHAERVKSTLPEGFTVVIEKPFVVVGDEGEAVVRRRAKETVGWAVERLKKEYFDKDPDVILDIWLFKDKASYDKYTKEIFHDEPTTPFGYFSYAHRALIMNISTGGGTLVHEIVHPFMRANFPKCPAWFNEGMGSLYEQCGDKDGRIWGYTNWRLAGLKEAIKKGKVPAFEELTGLSDEQFYNQDKGTNYAQARYLCYYLQEKGLLRRFYREFLANQKEDPTGVGTLRKVLGEDDLGAFEKRWEGWVVKLEFGG